MLIDITEEWEPEVTVTPDGSVLVLVDGEHSLRFRTIQAYLNWKAKENKFAQSAVLAHCRRGDLQLPIGDLPQAVGF